jgi:penicillin G amidase
MSFFERPDPRLASSADPPAAIAVIRAIGRNVVALVICCAIAVAIYAGDVAYGLHGVSRTSGVVTVRGPSSVVTIVRDDRDVPHVRAHDDWDMYFGDGYAQGSDRLFQLDLTRRYAYGTLSEVLGAKALPIDVAQRAVDIDGIARRQLRALPDVTRKALTAFSDGINAAAAGQPLPVEFRLLLYRPAPWTPKDSLAVSVVASLELSDSWNDVVARDAIWRSEGPQCFDALVPLSDERYDVSVRGDAIPRRTHIQTPDDCGPGNVASARRPAIGSNAWAAGSGRTLDGHALLANDPHLDVSIPGIWYVVDLQSPHVHVAGATIPGVPGVVLGHNERIAWASTNAQVATTGVFRFDSRARGGRWTRQHFAVRFVGDRVVRYYRTPAEFSIPGQAGSAPLLVRWPMYAQRRSTIETILQLNAAHDAGDAERALAGYRGSPQNFVVADRSGNVVYHMAGIVPDDPAWGRYVHAASELGRSFAALSFAQLPSAAPSRNAIVVSANNRSYGTSYPYRLSAQFEPPYRAYRIAQLMRARSRYDTAYFAAMQLDTFSPIDAEIAGDVVRGRAMQGVTRDELAAFDVLARWDGRFDPDSRGAALEHSVRYWLLGAGDPVGARLARLRSARADWEPGLEQDVAASLISATMDRRDWGAAGAIAIEHPLSPMRFGFLNGDMLPGSGNEDTIRLQEPGFAQGFRAVWDVGNWDAGGIVIPSGESGEPGSPHYTDSTPDWIVGRLSPLPFGDAAVRRLARQTLLLEPASSTTLGK